MDDEFLVARILSSVLTGFLNYGLRALKFFGLWKSKYSLFRGLSLVCDRRWIDTRHQLEDNSCPSFLWLISTYHHTSCLQDVVRDKILEDSRFTHFACVYDEKLKISPFQITCWRKQLKAHIKLKNKNGGNENKTRTRWSRWSSLNSSYSLELRAQISSVLSSLILLCSLTNSAMATGNIRKLPIKIHSTVCKGKLQLRTN